MYVEKNEFRWENVCIFACWLNAHWKKCLTGREMLTIHSISMHMLKQSHKTIGTYCTKHNDSKLETRNNHSSSSRTTYLLVNMTINRLRAIIEAWAVVVLILHLKQLPSLFIGCWNGRTPWMHLLGTRQFYQWKQMPVYGWLSVWYISVKSSADEWSLDQLHAVAFKLLLLIWKGNRKENRQTDRAISTDRGSHWFSDLQLLTVYYSAA